MKDEIDHTLEYLLEFDGRTHHYKDGYFVKFEIKRVAASRERRTACAIPSRCMVLMERG